MSDTKVTILKIMRNSETLRIVELDEVVSMIRRGDYREQVEAVREMWPLKGYPRREDGSSRGPEHLVKPLARLCFASQLVNRNHQRQLLGYTGLVLLEVNNLPGYAEAAAVRDGAAQMPHTLLAFVGASSRSVKILCRGQLLGGNREGAMGERSDGGGNLPTGDDLPRFHTNLYEKARLAYNAQLGVTVEKMEPGVERTCYISYDPQLYYNAQAVPFLTDCEEVRQAVSVVQPSTTEPEELVPGHNRYHSLELIYQYNLSRSLDDVEGITDEEGRNHLLITRLAGHCLATGLPMAIAQRLALFHHEMGQTPDLVRKVFENTYRDEHERQYRRRKEIPRPLKNIPQETLLTMKIDVFLRANYELRRNVMRGVAEYRQRTGLGFDFRDLTEEARNSITMHALSQGIKCWDKDIRRYVNSNEIEIYNPMQDFLDHLPRWDGQDRVKPLALRVKTKYEDWPYLFSLWMRSMVAMWLGKGQLTGNALVPLLIGRQGCGKSSFCRILIPRDLRLYYNDRINFKNESDLNLGLTSFALINLDEFDKITQRQQIVLKYLVSTADLKYRPPYGTAYSAHRRYASFIGTTNAQLPLTDPSGSRRFICVNVEGNIDFETPLNYQQLYAQLRQEINDGERYWLSKEEEAKLMEHNLQFQQISAIGEMLLSLFARPEMGDDESQCQWLLLKDISARLKQRFKSAYKEDAGSLIKIGNYLNRPEYKFQSRRTSQGMVYWVKIAE